MESKNPKRSDCILFHDSIAWTADNQWMSRLTCCTCEPIVTLDIACPKLQDLISKQASNHSPSLKSFSASATVSVNWLSKLERRWRLGPIVVRCFRSNCDLRSSSQNSPVSCQTLEKSVKTFFSRLLDSVNWLLEFNILKVNGSILNLDTLQSDTLLGHREPYGKQIEVLNTSSTPEPNRDQD